MYANKNKKKKKLAKLRREVAILLDDLAKSCEESRQRLLKARLLEEEQDNLHGAINL